MVGGLRLDTRIIQRIFKYFCCAAVQDRRGVEVCRALLPLAGVCRVWREYMLPHVYKTAHLERVSKSGHGGHVWVSNIDLVVSQKRNFVVRELQIHMREKESIVNIPSALDSFGFSSAYWPHVSVLSIVESYFILRYASQTDYNDHEAKAKRLRDYFVRLLPNTLCLRIEFLDHEDIKHAFTNRMVDAYLRQLYVLETGHSMPVTFRHRSFNQGLTHLTLSVDIDFENRLPFIFAAQLQSLTLYHIPEHFTWQSFYSDLPHHVVFENLRILRLHFNSEYASYHLLDCVKKESDIRRIIANDANCRQLLFPRLEFLSLDRSPYSHAAFYGLFEESPLQKFIVRGSFASMMNISPCMLQDIPQIGFCIYDRQESKHELVALYIKRLLCWPSSVEVAAIAGCASALPLSIPSNIGWYNIRSLNIDANLYLSSVITLATQCTLLKRLYLGGITNNEKHILTTFYNIYHQGPSHALCIGNTLEDLRVCIRGDTKDQEYLTTIYYMAITIKSLKNVYSPKRLKSKIADFIACSSDTFPHLCETRACDGWLFPKHMDFTFRACTNSPFNN